MISKVNDVFLQNNTIYKQNIQKNNEEKEQNNDAQQVKDPKQIEQELNTIDKEKDPEAYAKKLKELATSIMLYEGDDETITKFDELKQQTEIPTNTMYEKAYSNKENPFEQEELQEFLDENKILGVFGNSDDGFNFYDDELMNLFSDTKISVNEFKEKYIERKEKIEDELNKSLDEIEKEELFNNDFKAKNDKQERQLNDYWKLILSDKLKNNKLKLALANILKNNEIDTKM